MGDFTRVNAAEPDREDIQGELSDLRERHAHLAEQTEALRHEAAATARDLLEVIEKQRVMLEERAAAAATIAAIRASNSGRLLHATSQWRATVRRIRMTWLARGTRSRARRRRLSVPPPIATQPIGVNVAGYINSESGMGEATRWSIRALQLAGIPVSLQNVRPEVQRMGDQTFTDFSDTNPHPFNLVWLNADNMEAFAAERGQRYFKDRYTIGFWSWELESFRPDWLSAFEYVDEVWLGSDYSRRAVARDSPIPVVHVPYGLPVATVGPFGRAHFGLPEKAFIFLYVFDVSSQMERKNPAAAIRAFKRAALPHDDNLLVLKFTNGQTDRSAVRRLAELASDLNVVLLEGAMDRPEINALMRASDCYLSLHRAEGVGMTIAEAMALGKPAVATGYSGNLDFMTPEVSRLVNARLVPITRDIGPYLRGNRWADPDVNEAARALRELAQSPDGARDLGAAGARYVQRVLNPARMSHLMRSRLQQIRAGHVRISGIVPPPDDAASDYV